MMIDKDSILEFKAGQLICFSKGCYSDYCIIDHFICLKDLNEDVFKTYEEIYDQKSEKRYYNQDLFISLLIRDGYLMIIDCPEIHLGSYGELEISRS